MLTSIVGTNWGDEGKGRMVDLLSEKYDIVVRYQGGNNAVDDLPKEALEYIRYIEKVIECPIKYVSVGAERDAYITMF